MYEAYKALNNLQWLKWHKTKPNQPFSSKAFLFCFNDMSASSGIAFKLMVQRIMLRGYFYMALIRFTFIFFCIILFL